MRWEDFRQSSNVEDDRGGGGGFGLPFHGGGLGLGGMVVLGIIGWAFGINPFYLIQGAEMLNRGSGGYYEQPASNVRTSQPTDETGKFVAAVLGNTEDVWTQIFQERGATYRPPHLRLFNGSEQGGCGTAQAAMGPFYCPNDRRIYLDTSFFRDMRQRFHGCSGKPCDFAEAYVIAHEVGHHVQNLLGVLPKAHQAQQASGSRAQANRIQVRVELQADCFGGVWANRSNQKWKTVEPGDAEAALQTASAIGDDRLQKQARGYAVPDSFTHGTSAQRQRWFMTGLKQGTIAACNTFTAAQL
jgi:predicted metalloprotease